MYPRRRLRWRGWGRRGRSWTVSFYPWNIFPFISFIGSAYRQFCTYNYHSQLDDKCQISPQSLVSVEWLLMWSTHTHKLKVPSKLWNTLDLKVQNSLALIVCLRQTQNWALVIALVPLKCYSLNLQFPHRLPLPRRKCLGALALSKRKPDYVNVANFFSFFSCSIKEKEKISLDGEGDMRMRSSNQWLTKRTWQNRPQTRVHPE